MEKVRKLILVIEVRIHLTNEIKYELIFSSVTTSIYRTLGGQKFYKLKGEGNEFTWWVQEHFQEQGNQNEPLQEKITLDTK